MLSARRATSRKNLAVVDGWCLTRVHNTRLPLVTRHSMAAITGIQRETRCNKWSRLHVVMEQSAAKLSQMFFNCFCLISSSGIPTRMGRSPRAYQPGRNFFPGHTNRERWSKASWQASAANFSQIASNHFCLTSSSGIPTRMGPCPWAYQPGQDFFPVHTKRERWSKGLAVYFNLQQSIPAHTKRDGAAS